MFWQSKIRSSSWKALSIFWEFSSAPVSPIIDWQRDLLRYFRALTLSQIEPFVMPIQWLIQWGYLKWDREDTMDPISGILTSWPALSDTQYSRLTFWNWCLLVLRRLLNMKLSIAWGIASIDVLICVPFLKYKTTMKICLWRVQSPYHPLAIVPWGEMKWLEGWPRY